MRTILMLALLLCGGAQAMPFSSGDAAAGKRLFDRNHCNSCHDGMMHGDGNAIFTRPTHKVKNVEQLVDQMHVCSGNVGITLSAQDEQDLGAWLNQSFYHFK